MTLTRSVPWHAAAACTESPGAFHRALVSLGALFRAQALLDGSPGGTHDPAFIEADHWRLGHQRRDPHVGP